MNPTSRLCVIGNSHLAAVKLGWDQLASGHPGVQPRFFGSPRATLRELHWHGPVLVCRSEQVQRNLRMTSGGLDQIDLREFDAVLLCGLGFGLRQVAKLNLSHRHTGLAGQATAAHLVSRACFQAALRGQMEQTVAVRLGRLIREGCSLPLLLAPTPMPGEGLMQSQDEDIIRWWQPILEAGDEAALLADHEQACSTLVPPFTRILAQPPVTLASPLTSRQIYQQGAARLAGGNNEPQPDGDVMHMNAAYGAEVLREALAMLATLTVPEPA